MERPTGLPSGGALSEATFDQLVKDGVLQSSDCAESWNLSEVASLVFSKTESQKVMVDRFPKNKMSRAKPNKGHKLLVALMAEHSISYVLNLNYDLAIQNAVTEMGLSTEVLSVETSGIAVTANPTIIHLHGCINCPPDELVMRTEALDDEWRNNWEQLIATQVLAAPNILFSGLGSPAPVLSETINVIRQAIGENKPIYQSDIAERSVNQFAGALAVTEENYIQGGWSQTMELLSNRLKIELVDELKSSGQTLLENNGHAPEDVAKFQTLAETFKNLSLLDIGKFRANLYLDVDCEYRPDTKFDEKLEVYPLLKLLKGAELGGYELSPVSGGVWSLRNDGAVLGNVLLVSGMGSKSLPAIEKSITEVRESLSENRGIELSVVIAGGVNDVTLAGQMVDIIDAEVAEDILDGPRPPAVFSTSQPDFETNFVDWLSDD
ncbi:MAG: SIR2 family protein [Maricaulaceae bacterium]